MESFTYESIPFAGSGHEYIDEINLKTVRRQWRPFEGSVTREIHAVEGAEMVISATGIGTKVAFRDRPDLDTYALVTGYEVHAYVASQFEPRVVLLVERRHMGAEGETGSVLTVGVHLTAGYSQ